MPGVYDFSDGKIANNILDALEDCTANEILRLLRTDNIRYYKNGYKLSYKNLCYHALDTYAHISGYSVRYFLYGSDEAPLTHYSKIDALVIQALDSMESEHLTLLKKAVHAFYYSPIMDTELLKTTPSKRILAILKSRKGAGLIESIPENELYKYRENVTTEVARYKKTGYSYRFRFITDYLPDLATMVGVSLRWIMGIHDSPVYCKTAEADDIFDLFTLMTPTQKIGFVGILSRFSDYDIPELGQIFFEGSGVL